MNGTFNALALGAFSPLALFVLRLTKRGDLSRLCVCVVVSIRHCGVEDPAVSAHDATSDFKELSANVKLCDVAVGHHVAYVTISQLI